MTPAEQSPERRGPTRTCVGCRDTAAPEELVRLVLGPDGSIVPDVAGGAQGRGAWVHARPACLVQAAQRGLARSFKSEVRVTPEALVRELRLAASRRVVGLLRAALGARQLVLGASAVKEELVLGHVRLLVVATDARAAVESREVERAVSDGLAVAWGTKSELGAATQRGETGVVGVLDSGFARALRRSIELSHLSEPKSRSNASGDVSTEE